MTIKTSSIPHHKQSTCMEGSNTGGSISIYKIKITSWPYLNPTVLLLLYINMTMLRMSTHCQHLAMYKASLAMHGCNITNVRYITMGLHNRFFLQIMHAWDSSWAYVFNLTYTWERLLRFPAYFNPESKSSRLPQHIHTYLPACTYTIVYAHAKHSVSVCVLANSKRLNHGWP